MRLRNFFLSSTCNWIEQIRVLLFLFCFILKFLGGSTVGDASSINVKYQFLYVTLFRIQSGKISIVSINVDMN